MTKTEKLYYTHTSQEPFGAVITEIRPAENGKKGVVLDRTIFYPEGGGQPADRGTINGIAVFDVLEKDGEILHLVSAGPGEDLEPGPAELVLDSRRRRDFTALHTGQHLLSGTLLRVTGARTVSMRLGEDVCTIDVDTGGNSGAPKIDLDEKTLTAVEEIIADIIEENQPVIIHLCPPEDLASFPLRRLPPAGEEVIRVVEIEGSDIIACCGTHLNSTAEIGMFRILGAEKYKGMARVSFTAGRRALRDSRLLRRNAVIVSRALSVPLDETGRGILEFMEKAAQSEKKLKALEEAAVRTKAENLLRAGAARGGEAGGTAIIIKSFAREDIDEVFNIGKAAQKQIQSSSFSGFSGGEAVLILASLREKKFTAFSTAKNVDLRLLLKESMEASGGRGGGGPGFFQGGFGTQEALDAFLRKMVAKT